MAVFHSEGPMGMSPDDLIGCDIFDNPTVLHDSAGQVISHKSVDPHMQKIHDKMQSSVAAKLRRDEYRMQPAKMILGRASVMKRRSAKIIEEIKKYKD